MSSTKPSYSGQTDMAGKILVTSTQISPSQIEKAQQILQSSSQSEPELQGVVHSFQAADPTSGKLVTWTEFSSQQSRDQARQQLSQRFKKLQQQLGTDGDVNQESYDSLSMSQSR